VPALDYPARVREQSEHGSDERPSLREAPHAVERMAEQA